MKTSDPFRSDPDVLGCLADIYRARSADERKLAKLALADRLEELGLFLAACAWRRNAAEVPRHNVAASRRAA